MNVDPASNGAERLGAARRELAEQMRSVVRTPVMNGLQLKRELRAQPLYPCTPGALLATRGRALA